MFVNRSVYGFQISHNHRKNHAINQHQVFRSSIPGGLFFQVKDYIPYIRKEYTEETDDYIIYKVEPWAASKSLTFFSTLTIYGRKNEKGTVGTEVFGTKEVTVKATGKTVTVDNYAAFIKGDGELYQGLHELFGSYTVSFDVKLVGGEAVMFVRSATTGEILASKTITAVGVLAKNAAETIIEQYAPRADGS